MKSLFKKFVLTVVLVALGYAAVQVYDNFRERSTAEKMAEIIHLEDSRVLASTLKDYLFDPDERLQLRAALAVGRIGGEEAAKLLYELLNPETIDLSVQAAFAIGLTEQEDYAGRLVSKAGDFPSRVTAEMVVAAGRLADSTDSDVIGKLVLFLTHPSPEVRRAACMSLFRANAKSSAHKIIDLMKSESDDVVRHAALYSLARMGIADGYDTYVAYLADYDAEIRSLAVRGLGASDKTEALHYLAISLNDSDRRVAASAIRALAGKKTAEARKALSDRLKNERDEMLQVTLLNGLASQANEMAIAAAKQTLFGSASDNVVAAGIRYLATVEDDRAMSLIDSLATLKRPIISAACAEAYATVNHEGVIPRLAVLFKDSDPTVRAAAFESLTRIDSGNVNFYVRSALDDDNMILQALALGVIEERILRDYLPDMGQMMRSRETNTDVRRSLIGAAGKFLEANSNDSIPRKILLDGATDGDAVIRREAIRLFRTTLDEDRSYMQGETYTRISEGRIESAIEKFQSNPTALIATDRGEVEMELLFDKAPLTVLNFIELTEDGFFDSLSFHRIVPNFVAQGGDPTGTGWGGPGYSIRCEYSNESYSRGSVGIATSGKDTGGSQFFFTHSAQPHLGARYTVFGRVIRGMEAVDALVPGDRIITIIIREG